MPGANSVYAVVYTRLVPWLYRHRKRLTERIPFSLSLTFLVNRLMFRDIETELIGWEPYLKERFHIGEGFTVLDVGANIGQWTLWFARKVGPRGLVVALEPDPEANFWLRRNTRHLRQVVTFQVAAWREERTLFLSKSRVSFFSSVGESEATGDMVSALTLDSAARRLGLSRVDAMKMDVEGAEEAALAGASEVLSHCKLLLVEVHESRRTEILKETLSQKGFGVEVLRERWLLATKT